MSNIYNSGLRDPINYGEEPDWYRTRARKPKRKRRQAEPLPPVHPTNPILRDLRDFMRGQPASALPPLVEQYLAPDGRADVLVHIGRANLREHSHAVRVLYLLNIYIHRPRPELILEDA